MLHGPLFMKILLFALPLAASSVLQQLFNSVDVAVVGRFASSEALAEVGSNAPVINLLINLFVGISMGANAVISNHIGQNDREKIRSAVSTSAVVALLSGVFLMVLGTAVAGVEEYAGEGVADGEAQPYSVDAETGLEAEDVC